MSFGNSDALHFAQLSHAIYDIRAKWLGYQATTPNLPAAASVIS